MWPIFHEVDRKKLTFPDALVAQSTLLHKEKLTEDKSYKQGIFLPLSAV